MGWFQLYFKKKNCVCNTQIHSWKRIVVTPLLHILPGLSSYLFGDVEIEDHHAEVVDYEGFPECVGLAVLHVSRPRPQEEQVQAADDQCGHWRGHHWPVLHPLVCRQEKVDFTPLKVLFGLNM